MAAEAGEPKEYKGKVEGRGRSRKRPTDTVGPGVTKPGYTESPKGHSIVDPAYVRLIGDAFERFKTGYLADFERRLNTAVQIVGDGLYVGRTRDESGKIVEPGTPIPKALGDQTAQALKRVIKRLEAVEQGEIKVKTTIKGQEVEFSLSSAIDRILNGVLEYKPKFEYIRRFLGYGQRPDGSYPDPKELLGGYGSVAEMAKAYKELEEKVNRLGAKIGQLNLSDVGSVGELKPQIEALRSELAQLRKDIASNKTDFEKAIKKLEHYARRTSGEGRFRKIMDEIGED